MLEEAIRTGGSFLLEGTPPSQVFTPEDFREEHKMIIKTATDFVQNEVFSQVEQLEHKDFDLARKLLRKAGDLGLLGADIPEKYGGSEMGSIASLLINEYSVSAGSFGVVCGAHTGIGTMPLAFFGTPAQKEKYLGSLARGEKVSCYALTEPGAGTDALSISTTAKLTPDGKHYLLNGTKQFITNGGFADIIITYAKVDGDKMTCFLLERSYPGISTGPEEKKMGIRGSSTVSIILEDAKVPVENVIHEIGKGHTVAFNILDLGRFKLGAGCVGVSKMAIEAAVKYSKERIQFGKPICMNGLIKEKIANMVTRTYMAESMVYRTGGLIETILGTVDHSSENVGRESAKKISEYTIECSINKVFCSEVNAFVADEAVQMHGGYGFIEDYPVERIYRDCRIFRIFEGTNEINRIITVGWLMRKALKNELPFFAAAEKLKDELSSFEPVSPSAAGKPLAYESELVERAKKMFLFLAEAAAQKYGLGLEQEQEILGRLSDIAIEIYAMESGLLRAEKTIQTVGEQAAQGKTDMVQMYVNETMVRLAEYGRQILAVMDSGESLQQRLATLTNMVFVPPLNGVQLRRQIADRVIEAEKFIC